MTEAANKTVSSLLSALARAGEPGGHRAAPREAGLAVDESGRLSVRVPDLETLLARQNVEPGSGALARFLTGLLASSARTLHPRDPTCFVMDPDLLVQTADGESVLRLPWFEDGLFVGRQLPDITEMPHRVRRLAVENYLAAFEGERSRYEFTSYGHSFRVDAVPVCGESGSVDAVLAIAIPAIPFSHSAAAYESTAARLGRTASLAEERAATHRLAGSRDAEARDRDIALRARRGAARMQENARRTRARETGPEAQLRALTSRETEILELGSHGLAMTDIAEHLAMSVATVKTHHQKIYAKLGVRDKAEAVGFALRRGLIE
ncbi:MAG TPA: LuxR C-terminal-related transcriptional regulator [Solirubrobacteraceae bacterium]